MNNEMRRAVNQQRQGFQTITVPLDTALDNYTLPIAGNFLMLDNRSTGLCEIDFSPGLVGSPGCKILMTPGSRHVGPYSKPNISAASQPGAELRFIYSVDSVFEQMPEEPALIMCPSSEAVFTGTAAFVAVNSVIVANSIAMARGVRFSGSYALSYSIPTVDTFHSAIIPYFSQSGVANNRQILLDEDKVIVTSAAGWDVFHTFRIDGKSLGVGRTLDWGMRPINGAAITRNVFFYGRLRIGA